MCTYTEGSLIANDARPQAPELFVTDDNLSPGPARTSLLTSLPSHPRRPYLIHGPSVRAGSGDVCGRKVDVYAFGILLWCLHNGRRAYEDLNTYQIMFRKSAAYMIASSFSRFQPTNAFST